MKVLLSKRVSHLTKVMFPHKVFTAGVCYSWPLAWIRYLSGYGGRLIPWDLLAYEFFKITAYYFSHLMTDFTTSKRGAFGVCRNFFLTSQSAFDSCVCILLFSRLSQSRADAGFANTSIARTFTT